MSKSEIEDTAKTAVEKTPEKTVEDTSRIKVEGTQPKKPKRWRVILFGLVIVLLLSAMGGGLGYYAGIQRRLSQENSQRLNLAATHYQYGMQALMAENYELAKTQFEYVIQIYPEFPDISQKYAEAVIGMTKSQQHAEEPSQEPTRDIQGAETLFNQTLQEVYSQQWQTAVGTLRALRDEDYTYRTLEVDGLYWIALRYAGVDKITKDGDLEGGLYYLALAEQFTPLDHDAVNYALWARLYVTGASFWAVDWAQVVNYFSQLYSAFPYMHDGTGWTTIERYRVSLIEYGKILMQKGEYCDAEQKFRASLSIQYDGDAERLAEEALVLCLGPTDTPTPIVVETPTDTVEPTTTNDDG